jgi:hypothetical protein
MKWRNSTAKNCREIVRKLELEEGKARRNKYPRYSYMLDGKKQFSITLLLSFN